MKRFSALLLIALLSVTLISCGKASDDSADRQTTASKQSTEEKSTEKLTSEQNNSDRLCALDNGVSIELGADADDVILSLGEYSDYMEAPNCINDGYDKVYTYEGFTVTTSPDSKGNEYVAEIHLISDSVGLSNGIKIGTSIDALTAAYGDIGEESFGIYEFKSGEISYSVSADNGTVSDIILTFGIA